MNGTGFTIADLQVYSFCDLALKFGKRQAMFFVLGLTALGRISKWFIFPGITACAVRSSWPGMGIMSHRSFDDRDLCDWDEHQFGERRGGLSTLSLPGSRNLELHLDACCRVSHSIQRLDEALGVTRLRERLRSFASSSSRVHINSYFGVLPSSTA